MKTHFPFLLPLALVMAASSSSSSSSSSTVGGGSQDDDDDVLSKFPTCAHGCVKDFVHKRCPLVTTHDCFCPLYSSHPSALCYIKKDPTCDRDVIGIYASYLCVDWSIQETYTSSYYHLDDPYHPTSSHTTYTPYHSPNDAQPESLSTQTIIAVVTTTVGLVCAIAGCIIRNHIHQRQRLADSVGDPSRALESTQPDGNVSPPVLLPQNHHVDSSPPRPQQPSPEVGNPSVDEEPPTPRPTTVEPKES